jgi:Kelch motif
MTTAAMKIGYMRAPHPFGIAQPLGAELARQLITALSRVQFWLCILFIIFTFMPGTAQSQGIWLPLMNQPASAVVGTMILLSDGTVMAKSYGASWFLLTPDQQGSYINGHWSQLSDMNNVRQFFASNMLRDGRVFVAGGEDSQGTATAEVYDPQSKQWTPTPVPSALLDPSQPPPYKCSCPTQAFEDAMSMILADGTVLIAPACSKIRDGTLIYDPVANAWTQGPNCVHTGSKGSAQWEASWVKLPDDSILTIDDGTTYAERYIPALRAWISDRDVPIALYGAPGNQVPEIGPGVLLPNGRVIFFGSSGHTALYIPSGDTSMGTWMIGPNIPNGLVSDDGPASMMVNGKVLCVLANLSDGGSGPPIYFYEYDFATGPTGSFTPVGSPGNPAPGSSYNLKSNGAFFLALPDGNILAGFNSAQLYVYQPDCCRLTPGKPRVTTIDAGGNGSYHLTGTGLNGISAGAAFGDDAQMDSNYPLVRLRDNAGNVSYCRSTNWSSTGVMTGCRIVSVDFVPPSDLPASQYLLEVVANGIPSDPVPFPGTFSVTLSGCVLSCSPATYVPSQFSSTQAAYAAAADCSRIELLSGNYAEAPITFNQRKSVRLEGLRGPVRIGP